MHLSSESLLPSVGIPGEALSSLAQRWEPGVSSEVVTALMRAAASELG